MRYRAGGQPPSRPQPIKHSGIGWAVPEDVFTDDAWDDDQFNNLFKEDTAMMEDMKIIRKFIKKGCLKFMMFTFVLLLVAAFQATGDATTPPSKEVAPAAMAEKWGVEVVAMRTAMAGNMIDFRYKVLDSQRAASLFKRETKPYLIHQDSGKVLSVPVTAKVGPLRSSNNPQEGRTYWMFFGNQTKLVQKGDKVTVVIGEFKAENLTVQ